MTESEKGYVAGLIDGEGSICLTKNHANEFRSPAVEMSSTTYAMVEKMKELCGGTISNKNHQNPNWKQAWHWQVKGDKAINLLKEVKDFLLEPKKKARADLIVSTYKSVTPRNGKYNEETLTKKMKFEEDFFKL